MSDFLYASPLFTAIFIISLLGPINAAAYIYGGAPVLATLGVASVAALLGWLRSARLHPTRPSALNAYVASMVGLTAMYAEQWFGHVSRSLAEMFPHAFPSGVGISDRTFVAVFPLAGTAALCLGALAYSRGATLGIFAAWFTFSWSVVSAVAVYVLPLFAQTRTRVLPGAWTAPLLLVVALYGLYRLRKCEEPRLVTVRSLDGAARAEPRMFR